jgi:hypothetical protein
VLCELVRVALECLLDTMTEAGLTDLHDEEAP